jgi:hypothetical protein
LQREGYGWTHGDALVTVWSAPNYAYKEKNKASVMTMEPSANGGNVEFIIFKEDDRSAEKPGEAHIEYFA